MCSESSVKFSLQNDSDGAGSIDDEYSKDADEIDDVLKCRNVESSDSGLSSASEISICGIGDNCNGAVAPENESQTSDQASVAFLKTLLPWMQKSSSKACQASAASRDTNKIGGTLALIQYPRPANLPSKSAAEERSHRKQYSAILEEVRKREIRDECARRRYREEKLKREEQLANDSTHWYTDILPKFESLKDTKRVRELWWRGLPPSVRGKVWMLGIANDLNISTHQYNFYLERMDRDDTANESMMAIRLDVSRTFPNLGVFQEGGPLYETLRSVLAAYTMYRKDIGYVQGMSFIGAVLTLNMEADKAFACFANLLNNPCHRAAFTLNQRQMNVYYRVFASALAQKIPKIYLHFCNNGLSPDLYLLDWLYTVYAKAMPLDVVCRVWDVFIRDGDEFLFRTALGILRMFQDELLKMDFVRCAQFLTKLPENLQASVLFDNIRQIKTGIGMHTFHDMISQLS